MRRQRRVEIIYESERIRIVRELRVEVAPRGEDYEECLPLVPSEEAADVSGLSIIQIERRVRAGNISANERPIFEGV